MRKSTHKQSRKQWVTVFSHTLSLRAAVQLGHCVCVWVYLRVWLWGQGRWGQDVVIGGYFLLHMVSDPLHKLLVWWPKGTAPLYDFSISHTPPLICLWYKLCLNNTCCAFHTHDDVLDHPWSSSICTNWLLWAMPSTNAKVYKKKPTNKQTSTLIKSRLFSHYRVHRKMLQHFSNFDKVFRIFFLLICTCDKCLIVYVF